MNAKAPCVTAGGLLSLWKKNLLPIYGKILPRCIMSLKQHFAP